jgi:pilus assembly protein Flp/PilA
MLRLVMNCLRGKSGVTAIEYGLLASLVAVVIVGVVTTVGTDLSTTFNAIATKL